MQGFNKHTSYPKKMLRKMKMHWLFTLGYVDVCLTLHTIFEMLRYCSLVVA